MTTEQKVEVLKRILDSDYTDLRHFPLGTIYQDGSRSFATNGIALLAFDLQDGEIAPAPVTPSAVGIARATSKAQKIADDMREWLADKPDAQALDFAALRRFVHADEYRRCICCHGTCIRPVESLDKGKAGDSFFFDLFDQPRYVEIAGVKLNANLMAQPLAWLTDETVQAAMFHCGNSPVLWLAGDGWRLVVIGVRLSENENEGVEIYEEGK